MIKECALKLENIFHGKTSGIDVEVSVLGGTRAFNDGESVLVGNPSNCFHVVLVDTGVPRDSKKMITIAKGMMAKMSEEERLRRLCELEKLVKLLASEDACGLAHNVEPFQRFLVDIGVSHPSIDGFIAVLHETCGVQAKITGAGGGGFMYALFPKSPLHVLRVMKLKRILKMDPRTRDYNYTLSDVQYTGKGVQVAITQ